ncbi:hypothetical protein EAL2_c05990 [Peptoclostridium acidaminophilum DSM 3953]|uniref:Uncharacterized protein n=1 Tax=Peptoclostridium acidaminophilum DSM 3953 TaxID=1286171 RepID=W8U4L5_PEPAC|nr:hypothetical protein [Peptoclostridium acidaminophilum]AHM55901.1 hypothetical protein EAL2_c05990 [Peptoclostridium acidaminophilum DSM 3953]
MREVEEGKKAITYKMEVNPAKLMEEIYASIPELAPRFTEEGTEVHLRVFTNGNILTLWVDEEVEESLINVVVKAHKAGEE